MRRPYGGTPPRDIEGIVTGSVQIIDRQVRIAAFLEDSRTGLAVCCDSFDATQGNIFQTQKLVASTLADAVNTDARNAVTAPAKPASFDVKMAYSLGRYLFEKRDDQSAIDAIAQFEEAIRLDSAYGPAWLGLAYTYVNWPDYGSGVARDAMYDKALEVVAQGIVADPGIRQEAGLYELELIFTEEFRAFRQHREFEDFVTAVGLTEYWSSAGCGWLDDELRCR